MTKKSSFLGQAKQKEEKKNNNCAKKGRWFFLFYFFIVSSVNKPCKWSQLLLLLLLFRISFFCSSCWDSFWSHSRFLVLPVRSCCAVFFLFSTTLLYSKRWCGCRCCCCCNSMRCLPHKTYKTLTVKHFLEAVVMHLGFEFSLKRAWHCWGPCLSFADFGATLLSFSFFSYCCCGCCSDKQLRIIK